MFEVGCTVLYGNEGVCTVKDITSKEMGGSLRKYYVLEPVYQRKTTVFVPVDNERLASKMRNIVTSDEISSILAAVPTKTIPWIADHATRKEVYKEAITRGDCCELLRMCLTLHKRKDELAEQRRKLSVADGNFLKSAEKMVFDEFASALHIPPEQVLPIIRSHFEYEDKSSV
ncbi:MAG: CarD family transcriptional regulator [Raoultibacter sp.]|jgi:CarD family transcriptional regulator